MFKYNIGCNIEVYVDDILVKTAEADQHITDMEEAFAELRWNQMKLNPSKCILV